MIFTYKLYQPLNLVYEYLTDMNKMSSIHPIISKITSINDKEYKIYETLNIAFIPFNFEYPLFIQSDEMNHSITMKCIIMKMITVQLSFNLKEEGDHTCVKETIDINSILPIGFLMYNIFKKQHGIMFGNLNKVS